LAVKRRARTALSKAERLLRRLAQGSGFFANIQCNVPSPAQILNALLSLPAVAGEVLRCGVPADARFLSSHLIGYPFFHLSSHQLSTTKTSGFNDQPSAIFSTP
jgi:hypothetical protein